MKSEKKNDLCFCTKVNHYIFSNYKKEHLRRNLGFNYHTIQTNNTKRQDFRPLLFLSRHNMTASCVRLKPQLVSLSNYKLFHF